MFVRGIWGGGPEHRDGDGGDSNVPKPKTRDTASITLGRRLRSTMSLPEVLLWNELRHQKLGFRFRRQHRIDAYVLDFFCPHIRLNIEVDSNWHNGRLDQDSSRDAFLQSQGIFILRIAASSVLDKPDACALWVENACMEVSEWRASGCVSGFRSSEQVRYPP